MYKLLIGLLLVSSITSYANMINCNFHSIDVELVSNNERNTINLISSMSGEVTSFEVTDGVEIPLSNSISLVGKSDSSFLIEGVITDSIFLQVYKVNGIKKAILASGGNVYLNGTCHANNNK